MSLPLISCICPTYGRCPERQWLVEETVESFILQDYPNKELILINDCPEQTLELQNPRDDIRILNLTTRCETLGDKYDLAIEHAKGDWLCTWEDDDISLPWRLTKSWELTEGGKYHYINPCRYWYLTGNNEELHCDHPMGVGHNLSLYSRKLHSAVGGYGPISGPQDAIINGKMLNHAPNKPHNLPIQTNYNLQVSDWWYIYRWGCGSDYHLSGVGCNQHAYDTYGRINRHAGVFTLQPHWVKDYVAMTREHPQ